MSRMARSSLTSLIRRLYAAGRASDATGVPFDEIIGQTAPPRAAQVSRRRFIEAASAAAAFGLVGGPTVLRAAKPTPRVGIIGGGAAGLACAHRLHRFGIPSTVYEAQSWLGGRVFTSHYFGPGLPVERGGEFISSEHQSVRRLAARLGLDLEEVNGGGFVGGEDEVYFIDGDYYTAADAQRDWFDGKVWNILKSAIQDAPYPPTFDSFNAEHYRLDHLNLPDWLDQVGIGSSSRLGKLLQTDAVVEFGPRADEQTCLNLIYTLGYNGPTLQPLAGTDEAYHIVGGNGQLITRAAAELPPGSIQTSMALEAINGSPEGPFVLTFGGTDVTVDVLVLAIPFTTLRDVSIGPAIWGAFRPAKRRAIDQLTLGPNAKLHIQTSSRTWTNPIHTGGQTVMGNGICYTDPDDFICSWDATGANTTTPSPVLVNFLGGDLGANPQQSVAFAPGHPDDVNRFLQQVERVFPGTSLAYNGNALGSFWSKHPWSKGAYFSPTIGDYTSFFGAPGLQEGNIFFCGEHTEIDAYGFIQGAVHTGEEVAQEIHRQF